MFCSSTPTLKSPKINTFLYVEKRESKKSLNALKQFQIFILKGIVITVYSHRHYEVCTTKSKNTTHNHNLILHKNIQLALLLLQLRFKKYPLGQITQEQRPFEFRSYLHSVPNVTIRKLTLGKLSLTSVSETINMSVKSLI